MSNVGASDRITKEQATAIQANATLAGDVLVWVITENPSDLPGRFVARPASVKREVFYRVHLESDELDEVRTLLPPRLTLMPRDTTDDPVIVESWI